MSEFLLHPQLAKDCIRLSDLPLSTLLLMNNRDFPWCILVPRVPGVREIHELTATQQHRLLHESSRLSKIMLEVFAGEKMNIAALGNMVPQLHIHHIVRYSADKAWPNPVWGIGEGSKYNDEEIAEVSANIAAGFEASI